MADTNGVYATQTDLIAKHSKTVIVQLADHNNDGTIDSATMLRVWAEVDGEIDAYLATAGYKKTVGGNIPAILKSIAVDLAFAGLHTGNVGEMATMRAKLARETLTKIGSGKMKLELTSSLGNLKRKTMTAKSKKPPKSIVDGM